MSARAEDVARISAALAEARDAVRDCTPSGVRWKTLGNPVTETDELLDRILRESLLRSGEGWLSEESADDRARLEKRRVWVVDPLDGTREFVAGIPEWSISVGLVEDHVAVAGGICNPVTGEQVVGSLETGVTLGGVPVRASARSALDGARVLASRTEFDAGAWERYRGSQFHVTPMGSVAYKLALVAAGLADATWTLEPKSEWDVAAGCALVEAAGGSVTRIDRKPVRFNGADIRLPGLIATAPGIAIAVHALLAGAMR